MNNSIALEKAIKFALRIVELYKYLTSKKQEYVLSRQILLSGAYIAKHVKTALIRTEVFRLKCRKLLRRL